MSRLLENADAQPAAEVGFCTFCQMEFPSTTIGWSGGRAACAACRADHERDELAIRAEKSKDREARRPAARTHHAVEVGVDQAFRLGELTARWGAYGVGCYLATKYDAVSHLLHGLVMADLGTWLCTAWIDVRTQRWAVLIELVGFVALTQVMLHTDFLEVPNDPAALGLAFLAFAMFFTIKGSLALVKRLHND